MRVFPCNFRQFTLYAATGSCGIRGRHKSAFTSKFKSCRPDIGRLDMTISCVESFLCAVGRFWASVAKSVARGVRPPKQVGHRLRVAPHVVTQRSLQSPRTGSRSSAGTSGLKANCRAACGALSLAFERGYIDRCCASLASSADAEELRHQASS